MAKKYEIQTMKKDMEKLAKKVGMSTATAEDKAPDNLPMAPASPSLGGPLPPEPIAQAPLPPKLATTKEKKHKKFGPYKTTKRKFNKKTIAIIIGIAIIVLIAAGMYYWWNYMHISDSGTETIVEDPIDTITKMPDLILEDYKIEEIESLEINIPNEISNALGEEYTFFDYIQYVSPIGEEEGNRAGFIVEVIDYEVLKAGLRDWEHTMMEDLSPVFLNQGPVGTPATEEFQGNIYNGVEIRYINLPYSYISIDYAIISDYLIITTSKNSMYEVIDIILEE